MNQQRKDRLYFAHAVLVPTSIIFGFLSRFHVNNWVENCIMFLPGLVAGALLYVRWESFRSIGWSLRPPIYLLWAMLLPLLVITVSVLVSIRLGYTPAAPFSNAAGGATGHLVRVLKAIGICTVISIPFAFGEEFGWRGYAQGRLECEFGLLKGLLLLGILLGRLARANLLLHGRVSAAPDLRTIRHDTDRQHPGGGFDGLALYQVPEHLGADTGACIRRHFVELLQDSFPQPS